jgi:hypothetical protein
LVCGIIGAGSNGMGCMSSASRNVDTTAWWNSNKSSPKNVIYFFHITKKKEEKRDREREKKISLLLDCAINCNRNRIFGISNRKEARLYNQHNTFKGNEGLKMKKFSISVLQQYRYILWIIFKKVNVASRFWWGFCVTDGSN